MLQTQRGHHVVQVIIQMFGMGPCWNFHRGVHLAKFRFERITAVVRVHHPVVPGDCGFSGRVLLMATLVVGSIGNEVTVRYSPSCDASPSLASSATWNQSPTF